DRRCGNGVRKAGEQRRLPRGRLSQARRENDAHIHFIDAIAGNLGAPERLSDGNAAQTRCGHRRQATHEATDRGSDRAEDHDVGHGTKLLSNVRSQQGLTLKYTTKIVPLDEGFAINGCKHPFPSWSTRASASSW